MYIKKKYICNRKYNVQYSLLNFKIIMKRYLISVFSVCALAMGMASCSSEDFEPTPENVIKANIQKYGTRSSEVNLYLGNVNTNLQNATRVADVNGNMWGDLMPDYPTAEEATGILEYIQKNPGAKVAWPGYTYFFVQHVTGAHNKYSYTDRNNAVHNDIDGTSHLDKLEIEEDKEYNSWELDENGNPHSWASHYTHVNNFNNGQCNNDATHNATLMTQGFKAARAHDSYGNTNVNNWALYYWQGNYYLGIDYKMSKDDGSIEPDGIYDDWIVKILPGKGETPVVPETPDTPDTPDTPVALEGEVEFDIHQQIHKDWNEIKTSIHMRDTAAIHVNLPIPFEYQAVADDFDIRVGNEYEYIENIDAKFSFAGKEYSFPVEIRHAATGIDIFIDCTTDDAKEALKLARGVYGDGITFEIHSYVNPSVEPDQIWNWLKNTKRPDTKAAQWPESGEISTHTRGQVSSAYHMDEMVRFDERP